MPGTTPSPFSGEIPATIALDPPPLVLVLVQVRFASVASVARDEFFAPFQQELMGDYPLVGREQELILGPGPQPVPQAAALWRLTDEDERWRVTLATSFVALEARSYPGHGEFFRRLEQVLRAVQLRVRPPRVERLGVRYACRLEDVADLAALPRLVRQEVLGAAALDDAGIHPEVSITQSSFSLGQARLTARWGLLPANAVTDPTLPATGRRSWVLDIDVFDEERRPFDAQGLMSAAFDYSRLQYRFFRWSVEPAFLLRFGANPHEVAALKAG